MTTELLSSINMKRKLYKTHFLDGNPVQKIFYKKIFKQIDKNKNPRQTSLLRKGTAKP